MNFLRRSPHKNGKDRPFDRFSGIRPARAAKHTLSFKTESLPLQRSGRLPRVSKKSPIVKTQVLVIGDFGHNPYENQRKWLDTRKETWFFLRKAFWLTAQTASYRIPIRRRRRFACLEAFLDLWQLVKKEVFWQAEEPAAIAAGSLFMNKWRNFSFGGCFFGKVRYNISTHI